MQIDLSKFLIQFQDHLAPKLDTYEQAIYLYVFRHSRLIGLDEVTIGFTSARTRIATGVGQSGTPMSESSANKKLASLKEKGCIEIIDTNHRGRVVRLFLPSEIAGVIPSSTQAPSIDLEEMDFFNIPENRLLLLEREGSKCFYTLKNLTSSNFLVEHVVSRPIGNNSYRNCVAACREANNRKGASSAEDFLRSLYRDGTLSELEFGNRMHALAELKAGNLKPPLGGAPRTSLARLERDQANNTQISKPEEAKA